MADAIVKTQHTKGPWTVEAATSAHLCDVCLDYEVPGAGSPVPIGFAHCDDDDEHHPRIADLPGRISVAEAEANARLFAAAPNLLEELNRDREMLIELRDKHLDDAAAVVRAFVQKRIDATNAAIAKATGK